MTLRHKPVVFVAGIAVFVLALVYLVYGGIQQGASYWVTVSELRHRPSPGAPMRVRLGGTVVPGSVAWDASHEHLRFAVTDGEESIPVRYTGVVLDIFSAGCQVLVEGALQQDGSLPPQRSWRSAPPSITLLIPRARRSARG
jgi:cytochrome c-type biogenesis protein CcmE